MWQIIVLFYIVVGLILMLLPQVRIAIKESMDEVPINSNPFWKVAAYRICILSGLVLFWPYFLPSWFGKTKSAWDVLNENPEFQQQKKLYEILSRRCEDGDGVDADEMPNGRGEFGMTASNPIPCKTIFGSTAYLGRLRTADGTKVVYERYGSVGSDLFPDPIDAYEISLPSGQKLTTLFISPYQKRISSKAPSSLSDLARIML